MKHMKKLLSLLLVLCLVLSLSCTAFAAEAAKPLDGKTVILHSNDVHGAIDLYAAMAAMKADYEAQGAEVILADAGDYSQGTVYVSVNKGADAVTMMNATGYDVVTLGNHEFDYGYAQLVENMKAAKFKVLCADVLGADGKTIFDANTIIEKGGVKIGFFGLDTPEAQTKANPKLIQGLKFLAGADGKELYDCAAAQVADLKKQGADIVVCLAHLGVDESSEPYTSYDLAKNVQGIDFIIDGHSHTVMANKQVTDASGKAVTLTQTGSYFKNIGKMTVGADGTITTELINTYEGLDAAVAATASNWISAVDDMLGEKIAVGDSDFYVSDPATGKRRIRSAETNLGDFVADGIYTYFNEVEKLHCDVAIMNGGGIRADVPAGDWTFKTCKQVSPFGNVACLMSVTGKQIQDALEFGARFVGPEGKENGGFLQVAGATYEIHTDIPNTVQTDEKNVWIGSATGTPRVQNVKIYDKASGSYLPLDPGATYALAGMNYTLRNLGDGFAMFDGAELIKDYVSEDYLVMSTYAMFFDAVNDMPVLSSANSPLASYPGYLLNYENPYGAGRIQVV